MYVISQAFGQYLVGDGHEVFEVIPHIYEEKLHHSGITPIVYEFTTVSTFFVPLLDKVGCGDFQME